jgi:hypothetical protein
VTGEKPLSWGIIRYAPGTGVVPDEDVSRFDGWYSDRADAHDVYVRWCDRYPGWIVALVTYDEGRFEDTRVAK